MHICTEQYILHTWKIKHEIYHLFLTKLNKCTQLTTVRSRNFHPQYKQKQFFPLIKHVQSAHWKHLPYKIPTYGTKRWLAEERGHKFMAIDLVYSTPKSTSTLMKQALFFLEHPFFRRFSYKLQLTYISTISFIWNMFIMYNKKKSYICIKLPFNFFQLPPYAYRLKTQFIIIRLSNSTV